MVGMRMNGISAVKHNLTISSIVDNMLILHHGNLSVSFSFTNMDLIACTDIVFQCTILFVVKKISNKLIIQQKENLLKIVGKRVLFLSTWQSR